MIAALKGTPPSDFTPVDNSRFGGCGSSCQPVRVQPDSGGDDDSDGRLEDADIADFG
ncbi:hypothetical protein ACFQYP_55060 [Nonomuraea antimicrobica]